VSCASCKVDADRLIETDGPITTAGAAFAQTDLMMYLLRKRCGSQLAELTARVLLISGRQTQADFVVPELLAGGDKLVRQIIARVEKALPNPPSVSELASAFAMSERTLARHVQKATGKSTLALIQFVRLRRAKSLLEQTRMTVEQVAEAVGYSDSTALRKVMKKSFGIGPGQLR
ncbi:MAG TPA: helix-turn-helix domain-containing protein, partial [Pseudomonadales bacterium]|nr:helix-turn-helix domain-containing protein [Pseudomonadales bacterium]